VVARVAGGVEHRQWPPCQRDHLAIRQRLRAPGRHGDEFTVGAPHLFLAIDRQRAGPQRARVQQMAQAARVGREARVRQGLHQRASATGVIQVDVSGNHPVHAIGR